MSSSEFFTTPTIAERYNNFQLLSESGFNTLYSAEREGKRFVIKSLSKGYQGDILYEALIRKEFEIGYSLDHPNICRTISFEQLSDVGNSVVLEWIDGRTLDQYISEKRRTPKELHRILEQLCDALSYAHKRQVIHRDIKPQNIIITHNGDNLKLLDFGLSDTDQHTMLKEPAGSRKYASPELLRGDKIDLRSDIYSLGVIVNELFVGQCSAKVSKVVARATSYYPSSRYGDAADVAEALRDKPVKFIYPLLLLAFVSLFFLLYSLLQSQTNESLIPSAEADGVSVEEFERREVICNDFYREINDSYLELMNGDVYLMNCSTPDMPDFDKLSREHLEYYKNTLDSMLCRIENSSLCSNARRNMTSHNREMFTIMRNSFPAMFWLNTEQLYTAAKDSLANELRKIDAPRLDDNYSSLTYAQQQSENDRYRKALKEYNKSTIKVWAVEYRKRHNLSALPADILDYY